jgi:sugar phosphate permease
MNGARAWYVTVLLGLLYVVAYVDRLVLALLVEPLKAEFAVSDVSLGLLIGMTFGLFYAAVGVPLGRLADRGNRRNLVVAGVFVWGMATFLSAWVTSFAALAVLRIGVAIGEAVLTPCALSMISDMFPRERRAGATSFYVFCGATGGFGAYLFGGLVVAAANAAPTLDVLGFGPLSPWRAVFLIVSLPAFVLATLFVLTVKEPARSGPQVPAGATSGPVNEGLAGYLRCDGPMLAKIFVGSSLGQLILLGLTTWTPTFLVRRYGWSVDDAGVALGSYGIVAAMVGLALIPRLANRLTLGGRRDALPIVCAASVGIALPIILIATQMETGAAFIAVAALSFAPLVCTGTLAMIAIQWVAPPRAQAVLAAVLFLINSLIAFGGGPALVTVIAERGWFGAHDLGSAFAWLTAIAAPTGALLLWHSRRHFAQAYSRATSPSPSVGATLVPSVENAR